ncbi:MAG: FG-GAP-like repeat-containing protein [Methylococcales bacterium]|nr:FG-GAP-like repeat-containing protein [Methylococcales bacterium]
MVLVTGITLTQSNGNIAVTEGGATDSYTLVLDSAPTADVVITLGNTNGQVGTDVTTLTFTSANWNVAQTVTVTAVNDTMGEFTNTGVINYTVASTDANYNNFAIANTTVTVTDNDLAVGNPTFQAPVTNPFGLSNVGISSSVTFVDIDADGDLDAFMGNDVGDSVFFQNTGSATSAAFASASTDPFGLSNVGLYSRPTLVDIDGDGDLDAFVGNWYGNNWFFENTGNATSAAFASASIDPFWLSDVGYLASPTFVDIDNDGDLDAFVGEKYNGTLFFENTGTLTSAAFAASSTNPFGLSNLGYSAKPTFVDIDGDGDLDAFVGTDYLSNLFYENTGSATSAAFATASTDPFGLSNVGSYSSPTFVDIDGDGDLDALIGNSDGDTLFFVNNNAPTSTDVTVTTLEDTAVVLSISDFGTYSDSSVGNTATAWAAVQISTLASAGTLEYNNGTNWVAVTLDQEISVADITAGNLRFTPDLNGEGAGYATVGFKVSDGTTFSTTANTLTVDVTPVNDAPVIGGVTAVTNITDTATASPFSGFTIADVDSGASVTVSVAVDVAAKGSFTVASLTASGFTTLDGGLTYTHTADTPANAQTAIRALIFAPTANRVAPGNTETTTFTVSVNDGIATAVTDNSTTVVSSAPTNTAPTVTNLNQTIGYQVNNTASIADIVITDPDANTFTATLTLASKNSSIGSLTANSGHGETYSAATGVWSVSGTKVDVNAALAAVSFVPVSGGIASTKVAVSISDGMAPALNGTLNFIKGIYGDNNANNLVGTKNDDFISGGAYPLTFAADGKDTMNGGVGNDVYIVNDTTDLVVESGKTESDHTGGIDAVWSSATYNLPVGVENIIATGIAATTLGGNNLNNILDGSQASGANILVGGTGNDTYYLGAGDSVVELAAGGTDLVYSYGSIDMTSWFNIENTTLQGSTSESLTGNTLANVLTGNVGANLLIGATGNDTLNGVEGKDTLDGGLGNDILIGGAGKDVLITGAGSDVIRYAAGVTDTQANAASIANVDLANDLDFRLDKIDLTVKVAAKGALVTGNVTEATFVSDMNILLHQAGVGFNTTVVNDISGAIVTANAGDLSGRSFLAVDLDHNDSFTGSDFVIEITGSTNLASLALTSFI